MTFDPRPFFERAMELVQELRDRRRYSNGNGSDAVANAIERIRLKAHEAVVVEARRRFAERFPDLYALALSMELGPARDASIYWRKQARVARMAAAQFADEMDVSE